MEIKKKSALRQPAAPPPADNSPVFWEWIMGSQAPLSPHHHSCISLSFPWGFLVIVCPDVPLKQTVVEANKKLLLNPTCFKAQLQFMVWGEFLNLMAF